MAVTPGSVDTSLNTMSNRTPPVSIYMDQHRTNIICDLANIYDSPEDPGVLYYSNGPQLQSLLSLQSPVKATAIANVQNFLENLLDAIQQGDSVLANAGNTTGNATPGYDIQLFGGVYRLAKFALYDVSCINWTFTSVGASNQAALRFWLCMPVWDTNDNSTWYANQVIQWGYEPKINSPSS